MHRHRATSPVRQPALRVSLPPPQTTGSPMRSPTTPVRSSPLSPAATTRLMTGSTPTRAGTPVQNHQFSRTQSTTNQQHHRNPSAITRTHSNFSRSATYVSQTSKVSSSLASPTSPREPPASPATPTSPSVSFQRPKRITTSTVADVVSQRSQAIAACSPLSPPPQQQQRPSGSPTTNSSPSFSRSPTTPLQRTYNRTNSTPITNPSPTSPAITTRITTTTATYKRTDSSKPLNRTLSFAASVPTVRRPPPREQRTLDKDIQQKQDELTTDDDDNASNLESVEDEKKKAEIVAAEQEHEEVFEEQEREDPYRLHRKKPLLAQVEIAAPLICDPSDIRDMIAHTTLVPSFEDPDNKLRPLTSSEVEISDVKRGALIMTFELRNARHIYPHNEKVALTLQSDHDLRSKLSKALLFWRGKRFSFTAHSSAITQRDFAYLAQTTPFFPLMERALGRIVDEKPEDPYLVVLEVVAPELVARHREALKDEIEGIVEQRQVLHDKGRTANAAQLKAQLEIEKEKRKEAEKEYQKAVQAESMAKKELRSAEAEANVISPEARRLRTQVVALEEQIKILQAENAEKERDVKIIGDAREATMDSLVEELERTDAEVKEWKARTEEVRQIILRRRARHPDATEKELRHSLLDKGNVLELKHALFQVRQGRKLLMQKSRNVGVGASTSTSASAASSSSSPSEESRAASPERREALIKLDLAERKILKCLETEHNITDE